MGPVRHFTKNLSSYACEIFKKHFCIDFGFIRLSKNQRTMPTTKAVDIKCFRGTPREYFILWKTRFEAPLKGKNIWTSVQGTITEVTADLSSRNIKEEIYKASETIVEALCNCLTSNYVILVEVTLF